MFTTRKNTLQRVSKNLINKPHSSSKTEVERVADEYYKKFTNMEAGRFWLITALLSLQESPIALEIFLKRANAKITDFNLPYNDGHFTGEANPFTLCVDIGAPLKLAVLLDYYSKDVNTSFWLKDEQGQYLCLPPLIKAFLCRAKAEIRLLLLYKAQLFEVDPKKLLPYYLNWERAIPKDIMDFSAQALKQILKMLDINALANNYKRNQDFENAFKAYSQVGDCFNDFALSCEVECEEKTNNHLSIFYIRKALKKYTTALSCIGNHLQSLFINGDEFIALRDSLKAFYQKVLKNVASARPDELLEKDFQVFLNCWEIISRNLDHIQNTFEQAQNISSEDEQDYVYYGLRQRKHPESNPSSNSDSSDECDERTPLTSRHRY